MPTIVDPALPMMPLSEEKMREGFETQMAIHEGFTAFMEKRGARQSLEESIWAPGHTTPVKPDTVKPAAANTAVVPSAPGTSRRNRSRMNKAKKNKNKKTGQLGQYPVYSVKAPVDEDVAPEDNATKFTASEDTTFEDPAFKDAAIDETVIDDTATESSIATIDDAASAFVATVTGSKKFTLAPLDLSRINPEADVFVPGSAYSTSSEVANKGLSSNADFMDHVHRYMASPRWAEKHGGPTTARRPIPIVKPHEPLARVLLIKNVPEWLIICDIFGLIYGGAVEHIFRSNMAEITVIFCEVDACTAFLAAHPNGIQIKKVGSNDESVTMDIEKAPRGEDVTPAMQMKLASGATRVVCVEGVFDADKHRALSSLGMRYELEHIQFVWEKDKAVPAFFFFCGIADAWAFQRQIQDSDEWANFTAQFVADPCKVATCYHDNSVPIRMSAAVVEL